MTVYLSEILQEFSDATTKEMKILVLRKYANRESIRPHLIKMLDFYFNKKYLPIKIPRAWRTESVAIDLNPSSCYRNLNTMYVFECGSVSKPEKLERALLLILESMHKNEGDLIVSLIRKKMKIDGKQIKGLTQKLVSEVFPEIFQESEEDTPDESNNSNTGDDSNKQSSESSVNEEDGDNKNESED